ncbi:sugar-binding transcriptional regulator [Salimicrobium halophilum]|uniref:DNA-binding transcriptional regulator LsrR, DeoR family n=1 Tax=Salimicrobium halophilum TaxID=86666 RepID=A0A1G8UTS4_9BACI|nr:sugar-binding transcriptional regulator [Salimicrobium halophilum]SDJ56485.1 DNA-binding transcriptional regulator LsrR, DeoR family [Salimicrobium halophilum]
MYKSGEDRRIMVKVAKLYYFEGHTQAQIAKIIGVSRPIISKLLAQAREENVVEIYIKDESAHTVDLEMQIERHYGVREVIVLPKSDYQPEMVRKMLGKAAASHISKKVPHISKIGISWGKSVYSFVEEYPYRREDHLHIVPLIGGMGQSHLDLHSNILSLRLAQKINSSCSYLYAPAMMDNSELKERLLSSLDIFGVLEEGKNVDIAVVGLGNPVQNSTMEEIGYLSSEDVASLKRSNAIGDLNSQFYDVNGEPLNHPLNERVIGLGMEDLRNVPETVAIAEGLNKVKSIHAGLKSGIINTFITDDETATALMSHVDEGVTEQI